MSIPSESRHSSGADRSIFAALTRSKARWIFLAALGLGLMASVPLAVQAMHVSDGGSNTGVRLNGPR